MVRDTITIESKGACWVVIFPGGVHGQFSDRTSAEEFAFGAMDHEFFVEVSNSDGTVDRVGRFI